VRPLLAFLVARIRSLRGAFSGQYLAITLGPVADRAMIEEIRCRQIGEHVFGRIRGVANCRLDPLTREIIEEEQNVAAYRFAGFLDRRTMVVSYISAIPGVYSSGAVALHADGGADVLEGVWSGLAHGEIIAGRCTWIRLRPKVSLRTGRAAFLAAARGQLASARIESSALPKLAIWGGRAIGKSYFLAASIWKGTTTEPVSIERSADDDKKNEEL
jgi:hypothetical protein